MTQTSNSLASRVLSGGASLLFSQTATVLLAFAAQRIIFSTLSKEDNGELFIVRRVADLIVLILCDAGLNGVAIRKVARMPERATEIISSVAGFRLAMWTVGTIISLTYSGLAGYSVIDALVWCTYVVISSKTGLLRYTIELPYRIQVRFGFVSALSIMDGVLFVLFIWIMRDALTPSVIIMSFLLSVLPSLCILLLADRGRYFRPGNATWSMTKELLIDAAPILVSSVLLNIHDKADALLLGWFSTPRELGIYGAAYQTLSPLTGTIPIAAAMAIVPAIARLSTEDPVACRRFALTGLRLLAASAIGVATLASIATPWIIELISKGRYADDSLQFFTFMWMTVPIFILLYIQELHIAMGEQRRNIVITGAMAVVTILAGSVLIPTYDSFGAVLTKLAAVAVAAIMAYSLFHRVFSTSLDMRLTMGLLMAIAACVAAAVMLPGVMPMPAAMGLGLLVWIAASMLSGLIRFSDLALVRSTFNRRQIR